MIPVSRIPARLAALFCALIIATSVHAENVRPPAVAGTWYPGNSEQLGAYVDELLASKKPTGTGQGPVRALIAPHAGYKYSGAIAADAIREVRGKSFKRVLLLGPAHHSGFHGLSIANVTDYETPLGLIPLDLDTIKQLRTSPLVTADPLAHRTEHSLEIQLPLLQRALKPGWQLVPILVGRLDTEDYPTAVKLLRPLLDDNTLVVVSSDFTHYGARFNYQPFPVDKDTAARLESLDAGSLGFILNKDPRGFLDYKLRTGTTICGYQPVALLLNLLSPDSRGQLVSYDTSGRLTGDYGSSVSYMSIVFRDAADNASTGKLSDPGKVEIGDVKPRKISHGETDPEETDPGELPARDMKLLHDLAVTAVTAIVKPDDGTTDQHLEQLLHDIPPELQQPSPSFVTLMNAGQVRGCIGSLSSRRPLYEQVVLNGASAAQDYRFMPLQQDELEQLDIEVSVLTPPKRIDSYQDFVLGEEGVILEKDGHSSVYLPEVPTKYHWDREYMLTQLALKAGLSPDAWKQGATLKTFRTQKFTAPFTGLAH